MSGARHPLTRPAAAPDASGGRIIGTYGNDASGPLLLCVGGIHGNEPSGVVALRRVITRLEARKPPFRGRVLAVAGNLPALRANRRFIERDLNRGWSVRRVSAVLKQPASAEDLEQAALLGVLVPAIRDATGDVVLLDLHTTSSTSPPFVTLSDTLEIRTFAARLGLPLVLGIEEEIDTMVDYLSGFGALAIGIEAGRHDDPLSIAVHEAALWLSLHATGCLASDTGVVDLAACRRRLAEARRGLPGVFEVMYRRAIEPEDAFQMTPGFANFTPVRAGDVVARDARGPVPVPMSGRLFLPLYQAQGDDGYFLVRPVRPVWLRISRVLRRVGAPKLLPLLPGVHRSTRRADTLIVSRRVARWLVNEVFHLLGYRRVRETERHVVFRGRRPLLRD
ncbi:MAG TPA: succinylglutamate desuccinylase/aspartoacylase family protein [Gemmatimonadota bacterium]|nr:succinylglutamate desuccinylase/aspartoacylase family protein [Gemmatimonadota bacterium]